MSCNHQLCYAVNRAARCAFNTPPPRSSGFAAPPLRDFIKEHQDLLPTTEGWWEESLPHRGVVELYDDIVQAIKLRTSFGNEATVAKIAAALVTAFGAEIPAPIEPDPVAVG